LKPLGFLIKRATGMQPTPIPGSRLARVQQAVKRRLDDDILDVFERACATNDLDSATDLLALLEKRHARRAEAYGRERRINASIVQRARRDLERMRVLLGGSAQQSETPAEVS
jgi:hypothetical protein